METNAELLSCGYLVRSGLGRTRPEDPRAVRIEPANEWAWCGARRLQLTPRTFAVLRHLVEHQGRLITKEELFTTVWRDAIVSDAALASCIRDLRKALGDSSDAPRYIQTVHRRGFRFIGPIPRQTAVVSATGSSAPARESRLQSPASFTCSSNPTPTLVGREAELARLHASLARALSGQRQLVFVTGEPGIGKTALVEAFLAKVGEANALRIGCGQCVEQYGAGEAYLPVLEALGRLGRAAGGKRLIQTLKQHAPTWLEQLPGLLSDRDVEAVQRRAQGATRDRMRRELVEALDSLTQDAPLVLLLEDLHWSDSATIDLLGMLARRRESARLLVLGTYRPADVAAATAHPLRWVKHELRLHGHCDEIPLELLTVAAVSQYLSRRFPGHGLPAELPLVLHRNTEGNPLFLVNTIDYLIGQRQLQVVDGQWQLSGPAADIASRAPDTLRQLVEKQVERLTAEEQAVLAAGTQAGDTPQLLPVLLGVGRFYVVRGEFQTARDVGTHLLTMAEATRDAAMLLAAHNALGIVSLYAGDFEAGLHHLDRGIDLYRSNEHSPTRSPTFRLVPPGVTCAIHAAWTLWLLGYPDQAAARTREALALARSLDHPFGLSYACHLAAGLHQWRREHQMVQDLEDEALAHDTEHGFGLLLTAGMIQRGWLLAERGQREAGLAQIREGLARHREIGAAVLVPAVLALVAETHQKLGRPVEGLSALAEALMATRQSGQHYWEAELHRLTGVLTLQAGASATGDAESYFLRAIEIARRQRARSLELRAATSLSRLWAANRNVTEAHALLSGVYGWFTEGFDTADLTEAKSLLEELREKAEQPPDRDGEQESA